MSIEIRNSETHQITVSDLVVDVVRKPIKNLHLGVYPPNGRVRVAAPLSVNDEAVRLAIISRLGWIHRQREKFDAQPRQSQREMVRGESHYSLGQRYRLEIMPSSGAAKVKIKNKSVLQLYIRPESSDAQRERALQNWYREQLKILIPPLLEKWQAILGVEVADWGVKKMKTKWGTCNVSAGRVWINLELAKKPASCLEYIIVHELTHLLERNHNDRFVAILDAHLPQWRQHRALLNAAPLAHEDWLY